MADRVLILPGLKNSGPVHWQSLWQLKHPAYVRVMQRDWNSPDLNAWAASLERAIRAESGKVLLVAHSFGCLAALRRIGHGGAGIAGALLVAPADPDLFGVDADLPQSPLDVPTVLAASRNDPWLAFDKARALAHRLGSGFIDLGLAGHVNAESGYGPWPQGERLLLQISGERAIAPERALPRNFAFAP